MHDIDPDRFAIGTEFRNDKGGCWRIVDLNDDVLTLEPMKGTTIKPRDQLVARCFKIFGVWFKIESAANNRIVLRKKPVKAVDNATAETK